jgi:DNA recombination protein Rad52
MRFTEPQIKALSAKLNGKFVKTRIDGTRELSYLEGWHVIAEANRIFGFAGWDRETIDTRCVWDGVHQGQRKCAYTARVRVKVRVEGAEIVRDGSGAGTGAGPTQAEAHEAALKTAETDAMKRALATFGNAFGLALYDKDQNGVRQPPARPSGQAVQFVVRAGTGEPLSTHPEPKSFCSALRTQLEGVETAQALTALWRANQDTVTALRSTYPKLVSERGQHYADILEALAEGRLAELEPDVSPALAAQEAGAADGTVIALIDRPRRLRDRDHLRMVAAEACLICGRRPCQAHHLRFAQPRAMSLKVSDEWAVPLCVTHHRALHDAGDEEAWWAGQHIDPLPHAEALWQRSRGVGHETASRIAGPRTASAPDRSAGGEPEPHGLG